MTIQLAIADDHNLFIEGLMLLLNQEKSLSINGIANNARDLLELMKKNTYDIILLDVNMPGMTGLDAIATIKHSHPDVKIIMLSTYNEKHLIKKAKELGADGYLIKNVNKNELVLAIHQVYEGKHFFTDEQVEVNNTFNNDDAFLVQYSLTKKEKELLQLIKQGYTNKQMADTLFLSIYTIETHRKNIMQKLKLKNPADLMRFIVSNNL